MNASARRALCCCPGSACLPFSGYPVLSYQPLGAFNGPVALGIATVKALIVAAVFMELRERRP